MWIVQLALRRPYTFVVAALALLLLGVVTISHMPTDIFPIIDIPVVSVIWSFTGISPIENIHRNLAQGKPLIRAILDGASRLRPRRSSPR